MGEKDLTDCQSKLAKEVLEAVGRGEIETAFHVGSIEHDRDPSVYDLVKRVEEARKRPSTSKIRYAPAV